MISAASSLSQPLLPNLLEEQHALYWLREAGFVLLVILFLSLLLVGGTYLVHRRMARRRREVKDLHRRKRPCSKHRNPTLAETGGLPPRRLDESSWLTRSE